MHMAVDDEMPTEITYLGDLRDMTLGYHRQISFADDESQIVLLPYPSRADDQAIWLLDLATLEQTQIMDVVALKFVVGIEDPLWLASIQWQAGNLLMLTWGNDNSLSPQYISLNPATLELRTMIEIGTARNADTNDDIDKRKVGWNAISADGSVLIYYGANGHLYSLPTSLEGEPFLLGEFEGVAGINPDEAYHIAPNGRLLWGMTLLQFE